MFKSEDVAQTRDYCLLYAFEA